MVSIGLKYCRNMAQFSSPGVERYVYHGGFGPAEARLLDSTRESLLMVILFFDRSFNCFI